MSEDIFEAAIIGLGFCGPARWLLSLAKDAQWWALMLIRRYVRNRVRKTQDKQSLNCAKDHVCKGVGIYQNTQRIKIELK